MAAIPEDDQTLAPNNLNAAGKTEDASAPTSSAVSMSPEHKEGAG